MSTEIRFLPHAPEKLTAPTLADIESATLILDGAFIDVTPLFNQAADAMQDLQSVYETNLNFTIEYPVTRRENRQVKARFARLFRRPALIHKGKKPR